MRVTYKDQQLLGALRGNARASTTDLAKMLGVSRSTVQKRLERLETQGVISGFQISGSGNQSSCDDHGEPGYDHGDYPRHEAA